VGGRNVRRMTLEEHVEPVTDSERAVLATRGIAAPEHWSMASEGVWPCRRPWVKPSHQGEPAPRLPLARQPRSGAGLFHLWDAERGLLQTCRTCLRLPEEELGEPVATALVPYSQRCDPWNPWWARHVPRRVGRTLPAQWPQEKIPLWFVWWRLFELQGGRCALCWLPARMIDHDHRTGRVRGLLCHDCNSREGPYAVGRMVCVHQAPYCFEGYWADPPANSFAWTWPTSPKSGRPLETFRHARWPEVAEPRA
jgi:hypothetical protein